jgi:hypothetical protein
MTNRVSTYFHRTAAGNAIANGGFRHATGSYLLLGIELTGVFISDRPVDCNEGAKGDQLLAVELDEDVNLDGFEIVEDDKPYREWCVPAALLNARGAVRLLTDDERDEAERRAALEGSGELDGA